ncbi:putative Transcription initiation factor TFIID subunit 6 [Blattamonas nauphoetae]|uniref:Transcription initiation factor TFIID subunit 6 n=1 Tax=Blattamonas nauphoetae TaxID=2049346 RepID=A0ABQ9WZV1_9EUKA|nr:putative Transcription initiation factor TFIID subunit 6 [Blattamonas nauphoetae]
MFTSFSQVVAQSLSLNVTEGASNSLSIYSELELRSVIQDAALFMRRAKRTVLLPEDINAALQAQNKQSIFGYEHIEPPQYKNVIGMPDLHFTDDEIIDLDTIIDAPLPPVPHPPSFTAHWLAVKGIQPLIPQNPVPPQVKEELLASFPDLMGMRDQAQELRPYTESTTEQQPSNENNNNNGPNDQILPPARHDYSIEANLYFTKVAYIIMHPIEDYSQPPETPGIEPSAGDLYQQELEAVYTSLSNDAGLQQLVPYFAQFVAQETNNNISSISILYSLMRLVNALFRSPHLDLVPYCHILIPPVLTCTIGNQLGSETTPQFISGAYHTTLLRPAPIQPLEDRDLNSIATPSFSPLNRTSTPVQLTQNDLRQYCAILLSTICTKLSIALTTFEPRLVQTYLSCLMDPTRSLASHFGCVVGITALGPHVFQSVFLAHIPDYLKWCRPLLFSEDQQQRADVDTVVNAICEGLQKLCRHPHYFPVFPVQNVGGNLAPIPEPLSLPTDTQGRIAFIVPFFALYDSIGERTLDYFPELLESFNT